MAGGASGRDDFAGQRCQRLNNRTRPEGRSLVLEGFVQKVECRFDSFSDSGGGSERALGQEYLANVLKTQACIESLDLDGGNFGQDIEVCIPGIWDRDRLREERVICCCSAVIGEFAWYCGFSFSLLVRGMPSWSR